MGDRTYTTIRFSGVIDRDKLDGLVSAMENDNLKPDEFEWEGELDNEYFTQAFYDDQANYGDLDSTEAYCREVGISYRKVHDSGDGYEAGLEMYNALVDQTFDCPVYDGEPAITASGLIVAQEQGRLDEEIAFLISLSKFQENYPPLEIREANHQQVKRRN